MMPVYGMKVMRLTVGGLPDVRKLKYEARLKQYLSGEVSRDHSTEAVDGLGKG